MCRKEQKGNNPLVKVAMDYCWAGGKGLVRPRGSMHDCDLVLSSTCRLSFLGLHIQKCAPVPVSCLCLFSYARVSYTCSSPTHLPYPDSRKIIAKMPKVTLTQITNKDKLGSSPTALPPPSLPAPFTPTRSINPDTSPAAPPSSPPLSCICFRRTSCSSLYFSTSSGKTLINRGLCIEWVG